jgi:hypothetical protein
MKHKQNNKLYSSKFCVCTTCWSCICEVDNEKLNMDSATLIEFCPTCSKNSIFQIDTDYENLEILVFRNRLNRIENQYRHDEKTDTSI